jgi:hypothetical protein
MKREEKAHPEIVWCDCGTDAVGVLYFDDDGFMDDVVELTFWRNTSDGRYGWRHRIRQAWKWLRGDPESPAAVVLTHAEARRLRAALEPSER